ncbi:MAG: Ig-like domain-containing protein [Chloroflexi bacterium]|nr:Ig-like domain-containing protein [Chloroflexota bacterium]MCI0580237.1 Ig-like domain-containing protein [Chloroflexota bacterium]MCI0646902.1 Ig-like domain-containing protein [Chloroflexota bacterium]MCI0729093.1 Ig-like domain-containing protein [Chloroflexota bacterium]
MKRRFTPAYFVVLSLILALCLSIVSAACSGNRPTTPTPAATIDTQPVVPTHPTRPAATPTSRPASLEVSVDESLDLERFSPDAALILHFNQPMDPGSSQVPLLFSPGQAGRVSWSEDYTTLTFTASPAFRTGRHYTVTLNESLASASGQSLASLPGWELIVPVRPTVTRRSPSAQTVADRRPVIKLSFNKVMDRASVADALRVQPTVDYELAWQGQNLQITVAEALAFNTTYNFTLDSAATDQDGLSLARPYEWSYRLAGLVDLVTGPTNNAPDRPITVYFNYAVDTAGAADALSLEPAAAGQWTWDEGGRAAIFTPAGKLEANTRYTISFSGPLVDASGDSFPLPAPLVYTTPPSILSARPGGETAHPASAIEIRFDRPMDEAATEAAFQLAPETPGSFEWRETTLVFRPESGYLAEYTTYTVTLDLAARDADGRPILDETYTWSFQTGELDDLADFGWGPNAQVLDANGRRAVQFQAFTRADTPLTFELYQLTLEQFLDRYASGFKGVAGWENDRPISTEGAALAYRWEMATVEPLQEWTNVQEVIIPTDVPPGLYILNLVAGHVNDQLILLLTGNTVTVKQAEKQIVAWVSDINGDPVANIEVGVYARDGRLIDGGRTNGLGVFRATIPDYEAGGPPSIEPLIVIARNGDDVTASGLTPEWRGSWWGWSEPAPDAPGYAAYIYTDRPIYKPGQIVFFKATIRNDADAVLTVLPAGTPVTVRIRDARNNVVQTQELISNDFGSVDGSFQLAEGAMLGHYKVEIVLDGESHSQSFKVEDYRKPDYQVTVTTNTDRAIAGETIEITVDTRYFFGEPVANAQVSIQSFLLGENYYWEYSPGDYTWYESDGLVLSGRTNADGLFTATVPAEFDDYFANYAYYWRSSLEHTTWAFEATVDDGSHQTVSGFAVVRVYNAREYISLNTAGFAHTPGQPFTIRAEVATIFGDPVAGRQLRLRLLRWNSENYRYDVVVQSATMTTDAAGRATLNFTAEQPGYYELLVIGADSRGQAITYESWLYIFSHATTSWYGSQSAFQVAADQESYAPGETARLMIESTFAGPALLTFERATTRREMLVQLVPPITIVEVPIETTDTPNIHVVVNAWQALDTTITPETGSSLPDSQLHTASVNLVVPATDKVLNVTITPDQESYAPRDVATFTIQVTNHRGEPVSAEVSLAMVDEAIYTLSEELAGPIYDAFYFERDNLVRTFNALALRRSLYEGGMGGGGGDGGGAGGPRSDFPDTAAWFPTLTTNANGEVSVTITLPDNLTSWRLTARAATADTQVGEARINVITRQPVIIRPILPRALTAGDTVALSAMVHNYSEEPLQLAVAIGEGGEPHLAVTGPVTQTITVAPGAVHIVGWQAMAAAAGQAELVFQATPLSGDGRGDAVALPLTINPLAIPDVTTSVGQFTNRLETTVEMPAGALDMSTVEIQLSRSIAGSLLEGLEYLTGFPYGCVEQTMSKALPNAVVGRALNQLGVTNPTLEASLPGQINASVQRLYGFQHNDGGWGWWYDDATHDYQTAWVIFGLAITAEAGYEVDPAVIERGVGWLNENLASMDIRTRAFALYSMTLAGYPNGSETLALLEEIDRLDTFSQAALALALYKQGETAEAQSLLDRLAGTAVEGEGYVYWSGANDDGYYTHKTMASDLRSTALVLSAFSTIEPGHELEAGMVRWLMSQRRQHGWGTTNETSFAIIGLTDHLLATSYSESAASTGYSVTLNGEVIASGTLGRGEPAVTLTIPRAQLAVGSNDLVIAKDGSGQLYYVLNSRVYLAQAEIAAAGNITIIRTYLDPDTNQPLTAVEAGQLVKVRITFTLPSDASYLIIEDRLPGGLEALNEGLNTSSHVATVWEPTYYWQEYGYNYKEVRGDRVSFFITEMDRGTRSITYFARATHNGTFTAMPVEVYAMYDLALWGRSASVGFVVAPPEERG